MREGVSFFVIALVIFVLAYGYICSQGTCPRATANSPLQGDSVVGGPSLSAAKVDSILSSAGSPAAGTGNAFTLDSAQYNIDDAFALGIFKHESYQLATSDMIFLNRVAHQRKREGHGEDNTCSGTSSTGRCKSKNEK